MGPEGATHSNRSNFKGRLSGYLYAEIAKNDVYILYLSPVTSETLDPLLRLPKGKLVNKR